MRLLYWAVCLMCARKTLTNNKALLPEDFHGYSKPLRYKYVVRRCKVLWTDWHSHDSYLSSI